MTMQVSMQSRNFGSCWPQIPAWQRPHAPRCHSVSCKAAASHVWRPRLQSGSVSLRSRLRCSLAKQRRQQFSKQPARCQAAQPHSEGHRAGQSSSSDAALPSPASDAPMDSARQASNAATSSSAKASASDGQQGPKKTSFVRLLMNPFAVLAALLRRIAYFFRGIPAFVAKENLQRLHKKALDEPKNAERCIIYPQRVPLL